MLDVLTPALVAEITALGKTVLLLVGGTFILWSLYTAMIVPRKSPSFPRDLNAYILATVVLFVAQMSAVVWVTGTQEVEHEAAAEAEPGETPTPEPAPGGTGITEGDPAKGKQVFASAGCGTCHTLADAGAGGSIGPNLDSSKPAYALVVDRVSNGKGGMPSFKDKLDENQIADVAAYVSSVAGA